LTALISHFPKFCFADDEIVFRSYLMRGYGKADEKLTGAPSGTSQAEPLLLHIQAEEGGPGEDAFASLRGELASIYQFSSVMGLTSADMTWDGKKENLNEAVILGDLHIHPIQFYFRSLKGNIVSLKIEGFKFRIGEIRYLQEHERLKREISYGDFELFTDTEKIENGVGGEKWLDAELTLPLGTCLVLALPAVDRSYFLAIQTHKKEARQFSIGLANTRLEFFNVSDADPVCGRVVGRGDGIEKGHRAEASLTYKGYTFLFCSQACLEKFRKGQETCLKKSKVKYFSLLTLERNPSFIEVRKKPLDPAESTMSRPSILVRPVFPEACRERGIQGMVKTELQVGQSGDVIKIQIPESLEPELDAAAVEALRQWRYTPLPKDGRLASTSERVDVDFRLGQKQPAAEPSHIRERPLTLDSILRGAAEYCRRLEEAALNFVCLERIKETVSADRFLFPMIIRRRSPEFRRQIEPDGILVYGETEYRERNEWTYDYQLIRKEGRVIEQRILVKGNEGPKRDDGSGQELKRVYFSKPIYGPIGLLSKDFQRLYDYSVLREESVDGRAAWVLEIKPEKLSPGKANYGKAWVDKRDGSVLKMEIEAASLEGYQRIREDYVSRGIKPVFFIEILFGFERKGLRYPSRMAIKESYSDPEKGRTKVSQVTVDYDRYKFFTVETEDRIKHATTKSSDAQLSTLNFRTPL
jgi:TonB family protein